MKNAATLRKSIENAIANPNRATLARAMKAVEASEYPNEHERRELRLELQRNAEMFADVRCVSRDGLDDCLQLAREIEHRSLVIEIVGKPEADDYTRTRPFVARKHGIEVRGEVFRGWSRLGGDGWMVSIPGYPMHSTHRTIEDAIRYSLPIGAFEAKS